MTDKIEMKSAITMRDFATKPYILKNCVAANDGQGQEVVLGTILGSVSAVRRKSGVLPDGQAKESIVAEGVFEAIVREGNKRIQATAVFLPESYSRMVEEAVKEAAKTGANVEFGVEISVRPTGKTIPFAYAVTNIIPQTIASPLDRLRAMLSGGAAPALTAPEVEPAPAEGETGEVKEAEGGDSAAEAASTGSRRKAR